MEIRFLGVHNGESQTTGCVCLLIDDALAIEAGSLTSRLSLADQEGLEAILVSHEHYDHIRDIPGLALNLFRRGACVNLYSLARVRDTIETHLLNGVVYPRFQTLPEGRPTVSFHEIMPYAPQRVNGHAILPVPVQHAGGATVGFQISDKRGKILFYTADTGPGLSSCWEHISPQLIIIDVTVPNDYEVFARKTGHLTPKLLQEELRAFRELKGYLPPVIATHMDGALETAIRDETAAVAEALKASITVAREGMRLSI